MNDKTDDFKALQIRILERLARGDSTDETLVDLSRSLEALIPGAIVGITVLDRAARMFETAFFPSLPESFAEALKGARVAERPGSCALAVYDGASVYSEDLASDPRFQDGWKALSAEHGLGAIESHPAVADDGRTLGTLVVAFAAPRPKSDAETRVVVDGTRLAGFALARRRAELQNKLLVGELQHRTRNLFAAIGAVVYSTLKAYPDAEQFRKMFDGRLLALSRAHSMAVESGETDLRALLADIVAPYSIGHRIELDGPTLTLASDAAVAFSLATHELATNATKYGALSRAGGTLGIGWTVKPNADGDDMFELEWREQGGPVVSPPTRRGFGRNAIERSLSSAVDGAVSLDFAPTGLVCHIRAPLSQRLGALSR